MRISPGFDVAHVGYNYSTQPKLQRMGFGASACPDSKHFDHLRRCR